MKDWVKKGFAAGLGLAVVSKERAEKTMKDLVKRGEMTPNASREVLDKLVAKGEQEQEQLDHFLRERIRKVLNEMEIATREEMDQLKQHIRMLETRLDRVETRNRPQEEGETS
ncbi:polyhydroxyalkanoate synthesis regulator phasin [Melghirimyces profundicolus]|uniref:Polyhydroxyalkanoate synthesis regulator phasin n=1 Tax=Melghirimyces profundicolus TaxID=1242148 RepID=A0A2T6BGF2_9BACL|nr:polyhydroxyalkanoate synthesis regulator [Melghirimyces profundicolus]PTX55137.1 polyhydroxyalkanoate synthesis regulator phasin [Melghirimyces profundicolus]